MILKFQIKTRRPIQTCNMIDLKELQKEIMRNKIEKGFNVTDVALEFCRAHEELSEAFSKFSRSHPVLPRNSPMWRFFYSGCRKFSVLTFEKELVRKIEINKNRKYKKKNLPTAKIFLFALGHKKIPKKNNIRISPNK